MIVLTVGFASTTIPILALSATFHSHDKRVLPASSLETSQEAGNFSSDALSTSGGSKKSSAENITPVGRKLVSQAIDRHINLISLGAKCDGVTDDTVAINKWLAKATDVDDTSRANVDLVAPPGVCVFTSTLSNPQGRQSGNITIEGSGIGSTTFLYRGSSRNSDLVRIGDGINPQFNWSIKSFKIQSETKMTGGAALHVQGLVRSSLGDIVIDGQDGLGTLWNGLWLDQVDSIMSYGNNFSTGQNDAIRVNGGILGSADFGMMGWKVTPVNGGSSPAVGVHIGGGFGGFDCDGGSDIIGNTIGVLIDNSITHNKNREFAFGAMCGIDSSTNIGIKINDKLSQKGDMYINFAGAWIASSKGNNIEIERGVNGHLTYTGGTIFNAINNGVYDASNMIETYTGVQFRQNGRNGTGFGYYTVNPDPAVSLVGNDFLLNGGGETFGVNQNLYRRGTKNGGVAVGARISMSADENGISSIVPNFDNKSTNKNEGPVFSFHSTGRGADNLYIGNKISNPSFTINSSGAWIKTPKLCGNFNGSTGCLLIYDETGAKRLIPVWGGVTR